MTEREALVAAVLGEPCFPIDLYISVPARGPRANNPRAAVSNAAYLWMKRWSRKRVVYSGREWEISAPFGGYFDQDFCRYQTIWLSPLSAPPEQLLMRPKLQGIEGLRIHVSARWSLLDNCLFADTPDRSGPHVISRAVFKFGGPSGPSGPDGSAP